MKVLTLEKKKFNLARDFKQRLSEITGIENLKRKMDYHDRTADSEEESKHPWSKSVIDIQEERKQTRIDNDTY